MNEVRRLNVGGVEEINLRNKLFINKIYEGVFEGVYSRN